MKALCSLLIVGLASAAAATEPARLSDRLLQYLGFTAEEQVELRRGEIVSHAVNALSDKELALTMAMLVPASLEALLGFARSGQLEIGREVLSFGRLGAGSAGEVDSTGLQDVAFAPSEGDELRALLEVQPGSHFNLSRAELQRFAELRQRYQAKGCERDPNCTEAVVSTLRGVLQDRLAAYHEHGLSGISSYDRGGGRQADPAEELRIATNGARFLAREYPRIFGAFLNYPGGDQSGIESQFLWFKQRIQGRPTFILAHRVFWAGDGIAFAAERQFYVGQSYNSLQILSGLFPAGEKTLVVYVNRTSTDQIVGFMSETRHSVGRKMMEKEVREEFEQVRSSLGSRMNR